MLFIRGTVLHITLGLYRYTQDSNLMNPKRNPNPILTLSFNCNSCM